jgi:predicted enzyme related to lactoylglutathione lyase
MSSPIGRFVRHDLMCTDVPAATRFYTELFGWTATEVKAMGQTIVRLSLGEKALGAIIPFDRSHGYPSHWVPYACVASVDECCNRLRALEGRVCMGATDIPPGTFAMVNDPQGALFSPFTPRQGTAFELPPRVGVGEFCWDELMTTDPPAAKRFYQDLFGWESLDRDMGPAGTYTVYRLGEAMVAGMMAKPDADPGPPRWHSYVAVGDAPQALDRAQVLGATVLVPVTDIPDVGRFAVFNDPSGAGIAILEGI